MGAALKDFAEALVFHGLEGAYAGFELASAVFVVLKEVEAGAARAEQHRVAFAGELVGGAHGVFHTCRLGQKSNTSFKRLNNLVVVGSHSDDGLHLFLDKTKEFAVVVALVYAAQDQQINPVDVLILEGVGAGQKVVRDAGATLYWLDIDAEVGIARVLNRDGNQIAPQMKQWQIVQEIHFMQDKTRENAEHIQSS